MVRGEFMLALKEGAFDGSWTKLLWQSQMGLPCAPILKQALIDTMGTIAVFFALVCLCDLGCRIQSHAEHLVCLLRRGISLVGEGLSCPVPAHAYLCLLSTTTRATWVYFGGWFEAQWA